jgi:isoleucyl-tRNA synthetase
MEVHHHPEVEKKGFKEYILEGLMIFVAVMMGFIAESIRENITNGEHAKQLTMQLVRDLKNDTMILDENIAFERAEDKRNDSLFNILQQPLEKADRKRMQYLILKAYSLKLFYPSLGTIAAIKAELHIKQFANSKIAIYMTNYEDRANVLKELENIQKRNLEDYIGDFLKDHFTPSNMHRAFYDEKPISNGDMRDLTQSDLTRFSVELTLIEGFNKDLISYDKKLQANAVELINYVKKQYDLDDE